MKWIRLLFILIIFSPNVSAQVVTWSPLFATADDTITIIYDAAQGNGALAGVSPIYIHTGVITDKSPTENWWLYVKTNWGQNTAATLMQSLGNNKWQIRFHIRSYYGVPQDEQILKLALVFRNSAGTITGKNADGTDIFIPIYESGLQITLLSPSEFPLFLEKDDSFNIMAVGSYTENMSLFIEDSLIYQVADDTLSYVVHATEYGKRDVRVVAEDLTGAQKSVDFYYVVNYPLVVQELPEGMVDGINYIDESTVTLSLFAPNKNFVYVIGDFNYWEIDPDYCMNITPDSSRYWFTLTNLEPQKEYIYQYLVNGILRIADPYADKVSDPWNDAHIDDETYPDLISYPAGKTTEIASVLQTAQEPYEWEVTDFQPPDQKDLVIYELLIRDFIAEHNYQTLLDTLGYFEKLGINAIELMPVMEFEGNISWGYNPSFYFAPDKYYGTKNDFKEFVDEAHKRGIAVILDIVLNHAYGQCSLVRLYGDNMSQNPWFNVTSPNPVYSWGYDFNHQSQATKDFVDRVTAYWIQQYHVDGFRFDFSKGFTNTKGDGWARDEARITILKRIADEIWEINPNAYIILEHFTDNSEETELAEYGMMLWGNMNPPYSQSAMGWLEDSQRSSDLSWGYYLNRYWSKPHLVTYMESHDEPWLMYKNLQYGRSSGDYNIKELDTALDRIKLAAAFFFTIPGVKMMWQFGELGYDQELPESGLERTAPKPILWDYYQQLNRKSLFNTIAALIHLRNEHEVFRSTQSYVDMRVGQGQYGRRINIYHQDMCVTILGNFHVIPLDVTPNFHNTGSWFDYFSRDSIFVSDTQAPINLQPGEFRIYTDVKLDPPTTVSDRILSAPIVFELQQNFPNPFNPSTSFVFSIPHEDQVTIKIYNVLGKEVKTLVNEKQSTGTHRIEWNGTDVWGMPVSSGLYFYQIETSNQKQVKKMMLLR